MNRWTAPCGAVLMAAMLAGCRTSSTPTGPAPAADPAGTYALQSVNGSGLPYVVQSGASALTLTADVLTIASGGSWSESGSYRVTMNGTTTSQTAADGGTWSRSGVNLTLYRGSSGVQVYHGSIGNTQLYLTDNSLTYTFVK